MPPNWLYVTFIAEGVGVPALWQVSKAGGEPKLIAPGREGAGATKTELLEGTACRYVVVQGPWRDLETRPDGA